MMFDFIIQLLTTLIFTLSFIANSISEILIKYFVRKYPMKLNNVESCNVKDYSITFLIPIRNESVEVLNELLNSLKNIHGNFKILIIDDSDDEHYKKVIEVIENFKKKGLNIQVIHRDFPYGYKAGALNYAFKYVDTDYVTVLDIDIKPLNDYIKKLIKYLRNFDYVQGIAKLMPKYPTKIAKLTSLLEDLRVETLFKKCRFNFQISGHSYIIKRSVLEKVGGWNEKIGKFAEDMDLSIRLRINGFKGILIPEIVSIGYSTFTYSTFIPQQVRWFYGILRSYLYNFKQILTSKNLRLADKIQIMYVINQYWNLVTIGLSPYTTIVLHLLNVKLSVIYQIMIVLTYLSYGIVMYLVNRNEMRIAMNDIISLIELGLIYISISPILVLSPLICRKWIVTPKSLKQIMKFKGNEVIYLIPTYTLVLSSLILSIVDLTMILVILNFLILTSLIYSTYAIIQDYKILKQYLRNGY